MGTQDAAMFTNHLHPFSKWYWDNTIPGQNAQWAPKVLVLLFQNIHVEYWCDCKSYIHPASERVHG